MAKLTVWQIIGLSKWKFDEYTVYSGLGEKLFHSVVEVQLTVFK